MRIERGLMGEFVGHIGDVGEGFAKGAKNIDDEEDSLLQGKALDLNIV
jgi:hypothetical protein